MKNIRFLILFIILISLSSCVKITTKVSIIDKDYTSIKAASENVVEKLNLKKLEAPDSLDTFIKKQGKTTLYGFRKFIEPIGNDSSKVTLITLGGNKKISDNYNIAISSFLNQELNSDLVQMKPNNYYLPSKKSLNEFNKKLWLNAGYGLAYSSNENPFAYNSIGDARAIGFVDLLYSSLIIIGPFIGEKTEDKIMISLVGALGSIAFKFLARPMGKRSINEYNDILNSGYHLPSELKGSK